MGKYLIVKNEPVNPLKDLQSIIFSSKFFSTSTSVTTSHRRDVGDVLRFSGLCGVTHNADLQREHDLGLRVNQVRLVFGRWRDVKEASGEFRRPVSAPALVITDPVGLDDEGDPLQDFVQALLHVARLLQLRHQLQDDSGLHDAVDLFERGGVLDVERCAEGGGQRLCAHLFVEVFFGELRVVLQVFLHAGLVCHVEVGWFCYSSALVKSSICGDGRGATGKAELDQGRALAQTSILLRGPRASLTRPVSTDQKDGTGVRLRG